MADKTYQLTFELSDGTEKSVQFTAPQGPTGETGPQGEKGDTGAQGVQGEKGDTGAQGPRGEKGETGAQGPQGENGEAGATGKTAYEYAQDGGYTRTEEEFAKKLAAGSLQVELESTGIIDDSTGLFLFTSNTPLVNIIEAFNNGVAVYCALDPAGDTFGGVMVSCMGGDLAVFEVANSMNLARRYMIMGMRQDDSDVWVGSYLDGATMGDIPTALKNPKALTINGTAYDGSAAKSMNLATKEQGIYYIEGTGSTAGTWLGSHTDITEYYPGLTVLYKAPVASASPTTLNINSLGAVTVVRNATTALSSGIPADSVVLLTYTEDSGTAYWKRADYDANTKTTTGTSNKTGTKLYLAGATSQSSSGATTYSNANCYIGTDNRLYSGGAVVPNTDEINALIDTKLAAITNAEEVAF